MSTKPPRGVRPYQSRNLTSWLRKALNFPESVIPAALKTEEDQNGIFAPIQPTIDAYQGGIGLQQQISITAIMTVGQFLALSNLPQSVSPDYGYLICALSISGNALGATRNPVLAYFPTNPYADDVGIRIVTPPVASGVQAQWIAFSPSLQPLWCPPGFVPIIYANDLAGAESFSIKATLFVIPAGFKPL